MNLMSEFIGFGKIPRGSGDELITITEKLDGTNACIQVEFVYVGDGVNELHVVGVQSRKRMIDPGDDNYGFANWVNEQGNQLPTALGEGYHYGEWYGLGIQKNPHMKTTKRLALFNTERWQDGRQPRPEGVECVPILYEGVWHEDAVDSVMSDLRTDSMAVPYKAEGIVVWYHKTRRYEKYTYDFSAGKWGEK